MAGTGGFAEIVDGEVSKYYCDGEWKKSAWGERGNIFCCPLEITVISAKGLKKTDVYVDVYVRGDESNKKQRTPVHEVGSTNPWCSHTLAFTINEAPAWANHLKFQIKAKRTHRPDKDVGEVHLPVRELLEKGSASNGRPKVLSYNVSWPPGEIKGVLKFSYKYGKPFTIVASPPVENVEYPPLAGYRPQGHHGAPPLAYQKPLKKSRGRNILLRLFGHYLGRMMMDSAESAVFDVGNKI